MFGSHGWSLGRREATGSEPVERIVCARGRPGGAEASYYGHRFG